MKHARFIRRLALVCAALVALTVGAAAADKREEVSAATHAAGNDDLFFGYLKQQARKPSADVDFYASGAAGNHLDGFDRKLYDLLKAEIAKVAAGNRESTIFRFTPSDLGLKGRSWTAAELGVTITRDEKGQLSDATWNAVWEPLYKAIGHNRQSSSAAVMDKLLVDCPYELYWFAKSHEGEDAGAAHWTYHWSVQYNENKGFSFSDEAYLDVEMMVAENYAKSADDEHYYNYKIDTSLAKQAARTAANAKRIVDANADRSDFEKLAAYRDAICDAVTYDHDAARLGSDAYGNGAWQLIHVFDNNPDTNVVCEGYSKAFQYLCELSTFRGDTASYIITGSLVDRSGAASPHMWNHVRLDGAYWLVDVTNCDVENVSRDWLFFKAPASRENQNGKRSYAFARNGEIALRYTNLENAYEASEVLYLAEYDYAAPASNAVMTEPEVPPTEGETPTPAEDAASNPGGTLPENANWSVTYPVNVTAGSANFTVAPEGIPVSVTADPAPVGQRFLSWGGALGLVFTTGNINSASATFLMPAEPLYLSAVYEEVRFSDVQPGTYYEQPVAWAVSRGITTGTTATTFNPHDTCTRAQILTFLYRACKEPEVNVNAPFDDVKPSDYFFRPALWAYEHGLVDGGSFAPATPCTRAAIMVYLWKLAGSPTGAHNPFEDVSPEAEYAEAVAWAVSRGITTGVTASEFHPADTCTRAQIMTFLYRHLVETGGTLVAPTVEERNPDDGATTLDEPEEPSPEALPPSDNNGETTADSGDSGDVTPILG